MPPAPLLLLLSLVSSRREASRDISSAVDTSGRSAAPLSAMVLRRSSTLAALHGEEGNEANV